MSFRAWVDESGSYAERDPGTYLLASAVGCPEDVAAMVGTMSKLRLPSSGPKLHWRDESDRRRAAVVDAISELPIEGFVVVRTGSEHERAERRRRKCMERLLVELVALSCHDVIVESRGKADDRRDLKLLDSMRRSGALSAGLRMHHKPGPADPMLWIADALCGAVVQHRVGEPRYLKTLERRVTVEILDLK